MGDKPFRVRDVLRFHAALFKGFWGVLFSAEDLRQKITGLAWALAYPGIRLIGWLAPKVSDVLRLAVVPDWVTWAALVIGLAVFCCWMLMKANYQRFMTLEKKCDLLEKERDDEKEFSRTLVVARDLLKKSLEDAQPAIEYYEAARHAEEKDGRIWPLRHLARAAQVEAADLRDLAERLPPLKPGQSHPSSGLAAIVAEEFGPKRSTPEQIVAEYSREHAVKVLGLSSRAEKFGVICKQLEMACGVENKVPQTIILIAEGLEFIATELEGKTAAMEREDEKV